MYDKQLKIQSEIIYFPELTNNSLKNKLKENPTKKKVGQ